MSLRIGSLPLPLTVAVAAGSVFDDALILSDDESWTSAPELRFTGTTPITWVAVLSDSDRRATWTRSAADVTALLATAPPGGTIPVDLVLGSRVLGRGSVRTTGKTGIRTSSPVSLVTEPPLTVWPGTPGPAGAGSNGASAYEIAVANGFVGTEAQWLDSLQGEDGPVGPSGDGADAQMLAKVGLAGWVSKPFDLNNSTTPPTSRVHLMAMTVARAVPIVGLGAFIPTGGSSFAANQSFVGLYDSSGNRIAVSADGVADTVFAGGVARHAIANFTTPVTLPVGTLVYGAFLFTATTPPTFIQATTVTTPFLAPMHQLYGRVAGTLTSLPATVDIAAMESGRPYWVDLAS